MLQTIRIGTISGMAWKAAIAALDKSFFRVRFDRLTPLEKKHLRADLGVRHAAARLTTGPDTVRGNPGPLLEQWAGIELWKRLQYLGAGKLHYLRTKDGVEVFWPALVS